MYFNMIYDRTTNELDARVVNMIGWQSVMFQDLQLEYQKTMTTIYAGMIAENNKAFTKLGKRIKKLGVYVLLHEDSGVHFAANFMRGKTWREIVVMCEARGL